MAGRPRRKICQMAYPPGVPRGSGPLAGRPI